MSLEIDFLPGPPTSEMSRSAAVAAIQRHPSVRKGAEFAIEQLDGRWVAAIVHQAAPPFGAPADDDEESPGPKSEGPDDTAPDSEGPPSPSGDSDGPDDGGDGGSDGPPKEKGKGGESHKIEQMLEQICQALGLPIDMGDSPVPGLDPAAAPPGGPGGPPPGLGGPPGAGAPPHGGPPGGPPGGPQQMVHQRAMKPGETPPGGTPIGAPSFASVQVPQDHPWAHMVGKFASFKVGNEIGDRPLSEVNDELQQLAISSGYKVAKLTPTQTTDGKRAVEAVISVH